MIRCHEKFFPDVKIFCLCLRMSLILFTIESLGIAAFFAKRELSLDFTCVEVAFVEQLCEVKRMQPSTCSQICFGANFSHFVL